MKSSCTGVNNRVYLYWGQSFSGCSFLPWLMGHVLSKSADDTKLRAVAAKAIVSCHHPVIPQQAGETGLQDLMKFNRRKCQILLLGRNNPRHEDRLEDSWLECPFAGKDMVALVNTRSKNHPELRVQPGHKGIQMASCFIKKVASTWKEMIIWSEPLLWTGTPFTCDYKKDKLFWSFIFPILLFTVNTTTETARSPFAKPNK